MKHHNTCYNEVQLIKGQDGGSCPKIESLKTPSSENTILPYGLQPDVAKD